MADNKGVNKHLALIIAMVFVVPSVEAKPAKKEAPLCFLEIPMITGAGFSSGLDGESYIEHLTEKTSTQKNVIHEAYPGNEGKVILTYRSFHRNLKKASSVFALDFFYWDQLGCEDPSRKKQNEEAVTLLFEKTAAAGIPLIVGNLVGKQPYFTHLKDETPCTQAINAHLKKQCDQYPDRCLLIDLNEIGRKLERYYHPKIKEMSERDQNLFIRAKITRDGIHPRTEAYEVIATYMEEALKLSRLQCR